MEYIHFSIRIKKESVNKFRMWAKQKAVEQGRFSLNAWIVGLIEEGMAKEGI
jgi:hypothetical protein